MPTQIKNNNGLDHKKVNIKMEISTITQDFCSSWMTPILQLNTRTNNSIKLEVNQAVQLTPTIKLIATKLKKNLRIG